MAVPSASYSITVRLEVPADPAAVGLLTTAVGSAGGVVTALDVTESQPERLVLDLTCAARDAGHSEQLTAALQRVAGMACFGRRRSTRRSSCRASSTPRW